MAAPSPRPSRKPITDDISWTRTLDPRESYEIDYVDRHGQLSTRIVDVTKLGHSQDVDYFGATDRGKFKTFRTANLRRVRQLTEGHDPSLFAAPRYADQLPHFPVSGTAAIFRMPTVALSNRNWTVDLNLYTCTCPEKRERSARGYQPGQLGFVCPHMARAILAHLPTPNSWPPQLLKFLADPRRVHLDNLESAG